MESKACLLRERCPHRTAACLVLEPDDGCYVYRYFARIIKAKEKEFKNIIEDAVSKAGTWSRLEYLAIDLRRYVHDKDIQGEYRDKIRSAADVIEELAEFLKDGK